MQDHVRLEVALELISSKVAKLMKKIDKENNENLKDELKKAMIEKDKIYKGDLESVDNILKSYKGEF